MDDLLVNCPNLLKRPINNKVLASLGAKFGGKVSGGGTDLPIRKTSVCSLDEMRRREENESLNRVLSSPSLKSPVRTPVTENDPLGALCLAKSLEAPPDSTAGEGGLVGLKKLPSMEGVRNISSEIELDCKGTPILFERRKEKWDVKRRSSAGALHRSLSGGMERTENGVKEVVDGEEDDETDSRLKELDAAAGETTVLRASTLPADDRSSSQSGVSSGDHGSPFRTGLGNFKLPFR